jgi:putative protease
MQTINHKPELLAPAGTKEAFFAALENGADAVYVGLKSLNARAHARNFSLKELHFLQGHARQKGVKVFVAMNSLVKEEEIPEAVEMLSALETMGIDGLIIQDIGLWRLARNHFPGLRLHASTLMTIHNSLGVRQAYEMGFKRVVLAREMTLKEIKAAVDTASVEIEVFIHGAMCFTYSGLCLFSSFFGGNASTRGRCVQPCRRKFSQGSKQGNYFSMGDLCGLDALPELKKMGISSLKIEGRLRPPQYVENVVKAYRMAIDAAPDDKESVKAAKNMLKDALGRRFTKGYFFSHEPADAIAPHLAPNTGRYLGTIIKEKEGSILARGEKPPEKGSRIRLVRQKDQSQTTFRCFSTGKAHHGAFWIKAKTPIKAKKSDLLFLTDTATKKEYKAGKAPSFPKVNFSKIKTQYKKKANAVKKSLMERPYMKDSPVSGLFIKAGCQKDIFFIKGLKYNGIILDITGRNLKAMGNKKAPQRKKADIIWSLPPIIHEKRIPFYKNAIRRLWRSGHDSFQIGNLSQLQFFKGKAFSKRRVHILGHYTLNLLNSQAVAAAIDLGVEEPQLSIETDKKNARSVSAFLSGAPISMTMFAYPPMFTSRMRPGVLKRNASLISPKGEKFHWEKTRDVGHLFPQRPFSIMSQENELKKMGFKRLIVDITYRPPSLRLGKNWSGRSFNFNDRLK